MDASCANTHDVEAQIINTPNYPSNYGHNKQCTWKILAPQGETLQLDSFSYSMEDCKSCRCDGLDIHDGPNIGSTRIQQLCGNGSAGRIQSTGNVLFLRFYSDDSFQFGGFQINYSLIGASLYKLQR